MTLAAFDFDGTLTTRDSMWVFLRYYRGTWGFLWRFIWLSPWIVGYLLRIFPAYQVKEKVLSLFLKGEPAERIFQKGEVFCQEILPSILNKEGLHKLFWHRTQGHTCFLVTASLDFWTQNFAHTHGLRLVSTQGEIIEGSFTGKIWGKNCKGKEKVRRLLEEIAEVDIHTSYAYGDSSGDKELLEWADKPFFRRFQ